MRGWREDEVGGKRVRGWREDEGVDGKRMRGWREDEVDGEKVRGVEGG